MAPIASTVRSISSAVVNEQAESDRSSLDRAQLPMDERRAVDADAHCNPEVSVEDGADILVSRSGSARAGLRTDRFLKPIRRTALGHLCDYRPRYTLSAWKPVEGLWR
jgi:hypothetical protein